MTDLTPVKIMLKYKTEMKGHFGQYDSLLKLKQKGQKYVLLLRKIMKITKILSFLNCSDILSFLHSLKFVLIVNIINV